MNVQGKPFEYLESVSQMIQLRSIHVTDKDDEVLKELREFQDYCIHFISKRWLNYTKEILSLPASLSDIICGISKISLADIKTRDVVKNRTKVKSKIVNKVVV